MLALTTGATIALSNQYCVSRCSCRLIGTVVATISGTLRDAGIQQIALGQPQQFSHALLALRDRQLVRPDVAFSQ
jgi:hypothetical protein